LDGLERSIDLLEEGRSGSGFFKVVVLRRLIQFMLGETMKFGTVHSSQSGASIPKHVGC
jgi:hypothetical protein